MKKTKKKTNKKTKTKTNKKTNTMMARTFDFLTWPVPSSACPSFAPLKQTFSGLQCASSSNMEESTLVRQGKNMAGIIWSGSMAHHPSTYIVQTNIFSFDPKSKGASMQWVRTVIARIVRTKVSSELSVFSVVLHQTAWTNFRIVALVAFFCWCGYLCVILGGHLEEGWFRKESHGRVGTRISP